MSVTGLHFPVQKCRKKSLLFLSLPCKAWNYVLKTSNLLSTAVSRSHKQTRCFFHTPQAQLDWKFSDDRSIMTKPDESLSPVSPDAPESALACTFPARFVAWAWFKTSCTGTGLVFSGSGLGSFTSSFLSSGRGSTTTGLEGAHGEDTGSTTIGFGESSVGDSGTTMMGMGDTCLGGSGAMTTGGDETGVVESGWMTTGAEGTLSGSGRLDAWNHKHNTIRKPVRYCSYVTCNALTYNAQLPFVHQNHKQSVME